MNIKRVFLTLLSISAVLPSLKKADAQEIYAPTAFGNSVDEIDTNGEVTPFTASGLLNQPWDCVFDASGNLFIANFGGGTISEITPDGTVSTFAAGFDRPTALAFDASGNLYVSVWGDGSVHKITPEGAISTFASGFNYPEGLAFDRSGNLFVAVERVGAIAEITPEGNVSTFLSGGLGGNVGYIAFDSSGNLYAANWSAGTIFKIAPDRIISVFATGLNEPEALAFDGFGNLFVANEGNGSISEITPNGAVSTFATGINGAIGLAFPPQAGSTNSTNQMVLLDDFSTNSRADYNTVDAFAKKGVYGISDGLFAPTEPSGYGTTYYLRNTGESLSPSGGQSVSIDIFALGKAVNGGYQDAAGLGFSTSLNSDQNGNELILTQDNPGQYHLGSLGQFVGPSITNGFSLKNGPATLTITREATNPAIFHYSLTGGGVTQPSAEGTLTYPASAGVPVYFGMAVSYAPDDSHDAIREGNLAFSGQITPSSQTITPFEKFSSKTFGDAPFGFKIPRASSGLPVTVTVQSGPATLAGDKIILTGAGTVVLAADQSGDADFSAAPEVLGVINVKKANQRLLFPEIRSMKFTALPIELKAASSAGLPVSYTAYGPAEVSEIFSNSLILTGFGEVTVVASQAGNQDYNPAKSVTRKFKVKSP